MSSYHLMSSGIGEFATWLGKAIWILDVLIAVEVSPTKWCLVNFLSSYPSCDTISGIFQSTWFGNTFLVNYFCDLCVFLLVSLEDQFFSRILRCGWVLSTTCKFLWIPKSYNLQILVHECSSLVYEWKFWRSRIAVVIN